MAERTPLYMDINNVYSGDEMGLPNRDFISEGIVGAGDMAVSAGAGNTINIAAGACWVVGDTDVVNQPTYRIINDAVVNLGINPDPTNPRIIRVGMQINDAGFSGVLRNGVLTAIHGTPAGAPATPAEPSSFLTLATVLVPAAAASSAAYTIADVRPRARVGGGQAGGGSYRKNSGTTVVNTIVETDLLAGAITVRANEMGANGILRFTAFGDMINNSGGALGIPRWRFKFGATTIFDTNVIAGIWSTNAGNTPWFIHCVLMNQNAINAQQGYAFLQAELVNGVGGGAVGAGAGNGITFGESVFGGIGRIWNIGNNGAAEDTSTAKLVQLTQALPVANANVGVTLRGAFIEIF